MTAPRRPRDPTCRSLAIHFVARTRSGGPIELSESEADWLYAWVRFRMADEEWSLLATGDPEARCEFAAAMAATLGVPYEGPDEDTPAWALCVAAGWPS